MYHFIVIIVVKQKQFRFKQFKSPRCISRLFQNSGIYIHRYDISAGGLPKMIPPTLAYPLRELSKILTDSNQSIIIFTYNQMVFLLKLIIFPL